MNNDTRADYDVFFSSRVWFTCYCYVSRVISNLQFVSNIFFLVFVFQQKLALKIWNTFILNEIMNAGRNNVFYTRDIHEICGSSYWVYLCKTEATDLSFFTTLTIELPKYPKCEAFLMLVLDIIVNKVTSPF